MAEKRVISILYPDKDNLDFRSISDISCHDLGLDFICEKLSAKPNERIMLMSVMKNMSADPDVAAFRIEVFDDILGFPKMRERMVELLEQVQFLKDYGSFKKESL